MTAETAAQCLELLKNTPSIDTLDITGGAPELNEHFRYLVSTARAIRGKDLIIIDRCNLTVLQEPGQEDGGGGGERAQRPAAPRRLLP